MRGKLRLLVLALVVRAGAAQGCMGWDSQNVCAACNVFAGYAANPSAQCVSSGVADCLSVGADGACLLCVSGLAPRAGSCRPPSTPVCAFSAGDGLCDVCRTDYFVDSDSKCVSVIHLPAAANCGVRNPDGSCAKCVPGFHPRDGECLPLPENCAQQSIPEMCTRCESNSFFSQSPVPSFWRNYFSLVNYGAIDQSAAAECVANADPDCRVARDAASCLECAPDFFEAPNGRCAAVTAPVGNCRFYSDQTHCKECAAGHFLQANQCQPNPVVADVPNCVSFATSKTCARCAPGFFLLNGGCAPVSAPIPFCDVYADQNTCQFCDKDTVVENNNCVSRNRMLCAIFDRVSSCRYCVSGYQLANSVCVKTADIPNCLYYASGLCIRCNPGFVATEAGTCEMLVSGVMCRLYNKDGSCQLCEASNLDGGACSEMDHTSFDLLTACQGYENGKCVIAPLNKLINADGSFSIRRIENCVRQVDNVCLGCEPGFENLGHCRPSSPASFVRMQQSQTVPLCARPNNLMSNCADPGVLTTVPNCWAHYPDGTCMLCSNGGRLDSNSNSCVPQTGPANCLVAHSYNPSKCFACAQGYYLSSITQQCELAEVREHCLLHSKLGCFRCAEGHELSADGQSCVASSNVVANCLTWRQGVCVFCAPGFVLGPDGLCMLAVVRLGDPDCEVFRMNAETLQCLLCQTDAVLTKTGCVKFSEMPGLSPITGCKHHWMVNLPLEPEVFACAECQVNYYPVPTGCAQRPPDPQPQAYNFCLHAGPNQTCAECSPTHYLSDGFCVFANITLGYCLVRAAKGICALCSSDYLVSNEVCHSRLEHRECAVFLDEATCSVCNPGFYISSNSCLPQNQPIPGCELYASINECRKCSSGWALSASRQKCIASCEVASQEKCARCAPLMFPDGAGECQPVAQPPPPGCKYFSSATVCSECQKDFVLERDHSCSSRPATSPTCAATAKAPHDCSVCKPGFVIDSAGQCAQPSAAIAGCLMYDQSDSSKCLVCQPTHYQKGPSQPCLPLRGRDAMEVANYFAFWMYNTQN